MMPKVGGHGFLYAPHRNSDIRERASREEIAEIFGRADPARGYYEFKCLPLLPIFKATKQRGRQINEVL